MPVITLFEHQTQPYRVIGWAPDHPALAQLERLNEGAGSELLRLGRHHLRATQYVGVIRVGDTTIQVLPKIDYDPLGDAESSPGSAPRDLAVSSATRNLLYLLSYTHNLEIREQEIASLLTRRCDWFELLTRLFAADLHRQMQLGIERSYVRVSETLPVLRGRWELAQQLTSRPHVKHLFDVTHDDFSADTPMNQVFAFAVRHLLRATGEDTSRALLKDIDGWLAGVRNPGAVGSRLLSQVHFSRLNERFRPAYNLARLFVESRAMQLSSGAEQTFAFVLDMNRLFEEFVARFILRHRRHVLPPSWRGATIRLQSLGQVTYLAERLPERRGSFRLIPDVLFVHPLSGCLLVLDTKYKRLQRGAHQCGIAEADVYQMAAYSARFDCPRVLVLYPESQEAPPVPIEMELLGLNARLTVDTVNLRQPLDRPDELISGLRDVMKRAATAYRMEVA